MAHCGGVGGRAYQNLTVDILNSINKHKYCYALLSLVMRVFQVSVSCVRARVLSVGDVWDNTAITANHIPVITR